MEREVIAELIKSALEARKKAYAPFSDFQVGAAVLTNDGRIYTGCNIENASYGATICAERVAIFKAVSEGKKKLEAIAVAGGKCNQEITEYAYPCGICRQVMGEFADPAAFWVIVAQTMDTYEIYTLADLMPHGFAALE